MWRIWPPHVIKRVVDRVLSTTVDYPLLVDRMQPGFVRGNESRPERNALRAEPHCLRDAGAVRISPARPAGVGQESPAPSVCRGDDEVAPDRPVCKLASPHDRAPVLIRGLPARPEDAKPAGIGDGGGELRTRGSPEAHRED